MSRCLIRFFVMFIIYLGCMGFSLCEAESAQISYQVCFSEGDLFFSEKLGFDIVSLKGCVGSREYGCPDLPVKFIHLLLPVGYTATGVSITDFDQLILAGDFLLFPAQPDLKTDGSTKPKWVEPDFAVYNSDSPYPSQMVEIVEQGYLAGNHLVTLAVTPFRYYPLSGNLVFCNRLTINVELIPGERVSLVSRSQKRIPKIEQLYGKILHQLVSNKQDMSMLSFESSSSVPSRIGSEDTSCYEYLVITSPELISSFQPLVEWKTKKGVKACVVSLDSIVTNYSGRDDAEKLRNFLIQAYNQGTIWVLLGGDEDVVPIRYAYPTNTTSIPSNSNQQICDLYFSDVDGEWDLDNDGVWGEPQHDSPDIYPDLFVGRIPVSETAEVNAFVDKLLSYEKNPGGGTFDYLTQALWISSDQMRDWGEGIGQQSLLASYMPPNFYQDLNTLIESPTGDAENPIGPGGETCVDQMNQGWGIIGVLAHGKSSGFVAKSNLTNGNPKSWVLTYEGSVDGNGHMPNLGNDQEYGIMYSIACSQSAIDVDKYPYMGGEPCVAEFYPLVSQKGGVAFLGNTRWGWVSVSYRLFENFLENLFDDNQNHHLGVAEALSRCAYPGYRDIDYGHNLFGDPEMQVWTETPSELSAVHPEQITPGKQNVLVSVSSERSGVSGAQVCLTLGGRITFLGQTNEEGQIYCNLDLDDVGEMSLVVTKPNFIPYEDSITVSLVADVDDDADIVADMWSFELSQNHPNPFNPTTSIQYTVDSRQTSQPTTLKIYNVLGQKVRTLVDEKKKPGRYQVVWNGKDDGTNDVASGIYFCTLQVGEYRETKKMSLIR